VKRESSARTAGQASQPQPAAGQHERAHRAGSDRRPAGV